MVNVQAKGARVDLLDRDQGSLEGALTKIKTDASKEKGREALTNSRDMVIWIETWKPTRMTLWRII